MNVYVDESGNHKRTGYTALSFVIIESDDLSRTEILVAEVERGHAKGTFHWVASSWTVREEFLMGTNTVRYRFLAVVIENPVLDLSPAIELGLTGIQADLGKISLIIDGDKGRGFERRFKKLLRDRGVNTRKLRTAKDEGFAGLRLADAIAGLHRYLAEKPEHPSAARLAKAIGRHRLK
jgi:hypothetical protein